MRLGREQVGAVAAPRVGELGLGLLGGGLGRGLAEIQRRNTVA
jgi:hypothetical protein